MHWSAQLIGISVVAYAALVGGCYAVQRSLMYFPSSDLPTPAAAGAPEMSPVTLRTADGLELVAWYAPPAMQALPTIVYFHGNAGNIADRVGKVRPFLDEGYGVTLVSYRGYGGNPGAPTEQGLYEDGYAALDFMASRGIREDRTVLLGESLGTGVAVRMASERRVGAVILEAPMTSAAEVGQRAYPFLPVKLFIKDRFETLSLIDRIDAPLLIVHGERDRVVPVSHGRRLFAAAAEPKEAVFLPAAGHNDLFEHDAARAEVDFLRRVFPDPR
ncbi:MAG: alpha/beta hydrolase [Alphaproteobacteria bacterium]